VINRRKTYAKRVKPFHFLSQANAIDHPFEDRLKGEIRLNRFVFM